jgi:hypothetical protein
VSASSTQFTFFVVICDRERVQRIMWTTPGSEPVGQTPEVVLVDRVQHPGRRPAGRSCPPAWRCRAGRSRPSALPDEHAPTRLGPVAPRMQPLVQIPEVVLSDPARRPPTSPRPPPPQRSHLITRYAARSRATSTWCNSAANRAFLSRTPHLPHTTGRIGRVLPGTIVRDAFCWPCSALAGPLSSPVSAAAALFSRVRRYYGTVTTAHDRSSQHDRLGVAWAARPVISPAGGHGLSRFSHMKVRLHALVLGPRGVRRCLEIAPPPMLPSADPSAWAPRTAHFVAQ